MFSNSVGQEKETLYSSSKYKFSLRQQLVLVLFLSSFRINLEAF